MQESLCNPAKEAQSIRHAQAPDPPAMMGHQDGPAVTVRFPEKRKMEGIYGLALLSASVLLLAFAAKYRNGPNAATWVKSSAIVQIVLFTTVTGFVFAISMLIQFAVNVETESLGVTEAGFLAAIAVVTWLCWYRIRKMPGAPRAVVGTVEDLPPPANTDGPSLRTGRKGARKAA
jgi:hypothetical protein